MITASVGFHCPECVKSSAQANPVYDIHNPPAFRPWATLVLIAINGTVFVVDVVTGASSSGVPGLSGGSGPVVSGQLTQLGGLSATHVAAGQIYRLVTAGFLHAGFVHLALNMLALYFLGSALERLLGPARFTTLYFAALFAGSMGVVVFAPGEYTVGASGAIYGLMGAALAESQTTRRINLWQSSLGAILVLNLVFTFAAPGISIMGHLGGLLGGVVVGAAMFQLERSRKSLWIGIGAAALLGVACIVTAVVLAPQVIIIR